MIEALLMGGGAMGAKIKSIQRIANTDLSGTGNSGPISISPVDPSKTIVFFSDTMSTSAPSIGRLKGCVHLNNATQLEYLGTGFNAVSSLFSITVVEYDGEINVQRGKTIVPAGSGTITETLPVPVDPESSIEMSDSAYVDGSFDARIADVVCTIRLLSASTIELRRQGSNFQSQVAWQVVEFL